MWNSVVQTPDFIHSVSNQGPWKSTSCNHKTTDIYGTISESLKNSGLVIPATALTEKTDLFPFMRKYTDYWMLLDSDAWGGKACFHSADRVGVSRPTGSHQTFCQYY